MGRASRKRAEQRRTAAASGPVSARQERAPSNGAAAPARTAERQDALPVRRNRRAPARRLPLQARTDLQSLEELCRTRGEIEASIAVLVAALQSLGADWGVIGRALGVSRQAARQRYGTRMP